MVYLQLPDTMQCLCFTVLLSGSNCWQYIVIWLCTWVLDIQICIIWSGRREKRGGCLSSWKCFPYVDMFCVMKTELNMTLHVVQTILPTILPVSYVPGSHYKHKLSCSSLVNRTPLKHTVCGRKMNFSILLICFLFSFPPSNSLPFLLCPPFAPFLPEKHVEQLPEACVQTGYPWLSHLNRLFSMRQLWVANLQGPARTSLKTTQSADAPLCMFTQLVWEQTLLS